MLFRSNTFLAWFVCALMFLLGVQISLAEEGGPTPTLSTTESSPTNSGSIPVTITFDESVTEFAVDDLEPTNATLSTFAGSGAVYTVNLIPITDGTVSLSIPENIALGEESVANQPSNVLSLTYDDTRPIGTLATTQESPTTNTSFTITVSFSEDVTGLSLGDFDVSGATLSNLTGSGDSYSFTVTSSLGNSAMVTLPRHTVLDSAGNNNAAESNTILVVISEEGSGGGEGEGEGEGGEGGEGGDEGGEDEESGGGSGSSGSSSQNGSLSEVPTQENPGGDTANLRNVMAAQGFNRQKMAQHLDSGESALNTFDENYAASMELASTLSQKVESKVLTYQDVFGRDRFLGYRRGRKGLDDFKENPRNLVYRRNDRVNDTYLTSAEEGFQPQFTVMDFRDLEPDHEQYPVIAAMRTIGLMRPDRFHRVHPRAHLDWELYLEAMLWIKHRTVLSYDVLERANLSLEGIALEDTRRSRIFYTALYHDLIDPDFAQEQAELSRGYVLSSLAYLTDLDLSETDSRNYFVDIDQEHDLYDIVQAAAHRHWFRGTELTRLAQDRPMSRLLFAQIFINALGENNPWSDTPAFAKMGEKLDDLYYESYTQNREGASKEVYYESYIHKGEENRIRRQYQTQGKGGSFRRGRKREDTAEAYLKARQARERSRAHDYDLYGFPKQD